MKYTTEEIVIPKELYKTMLDNSFDMAKRELEYAVEKLGNEYDEKQFGDYLLHVCPKCKNTELHFYNMFTAKDKTKRVLHCECPNCNSTLWIYQEAKTK